MEITENRTQLLKNATNQLKPIKNKKPLVDKFNEITGQKQASLPRIALKLFIEKKISDYSDVVNYINNKHSEDTNAILAKALNRVRNEKVELRKNAEIANEKYAEKKEKIRKDKAEEVRKQKIIDKLDKVAIFKTNKINMESDKLISALNTIREKKGDYITKERNKLIRQKNKLNILRENKTIDKDFYKKNKKRNTYKMAKLDKLETKYKNSEYQRMEKEKLRINEGRKKELAEVRKYLRTKEQKEAFKEKYGVFTDNDIYNNNEDNFNELRVESITQVDSLKHFRVYHVNLVNPASNIEVFYRYITQTLDEYNAGNVVLYIRDITGTGVRHITINGNHTYSVEEFEERINEILGGDVAGSDVLATGGNYELMLNTFDIQIMALSGYADNNDNIIYKSTKTTNDALRDCGFKALCRALGDGCYDTGLFIMKDKYKKDYNNIEDFTTVSNLITFISMNKLKISIFPNGIVLKKGRSHRNLLKDRRIETKINNKKTLVAKIDNGDILTPTPIFKTEDAKQYIIYDAKNSHFEYAIDGKIEINENIYIGVDCAIYKKENEKYRRFMSCENNNFNLNDINKLETVYVGFDFETVIDYTAKNRVKPYSVSYGIFTEDDIETLDYADKNNDKDFIAKLRKRLMKTSVGFGCEDEFIKWIVRNQPDKKFVFIGFNNANFDNYILIDRVLELNNDDMRISNIMYNGSQLLNATINGRHTFFDLSRHILGTLNKCCEGFKVGLCAKLAFNHFEYQQKHDNGDLLDYINNNQELIDYNENDVLSVLIIYNRYKRAIGEIKGMEELAKDLHNNLTIGALSYKRFKEHWKTEKINLPKLAEEQYYNVLKFKCAGRVEMFNGKQFIEETVCSYDVCSLYPYVMAVLDCYYPCGEIVDTDVFVDDKIGFYSCDIDQSILKTHNLPNIYPKKTETENIWDYTGVLFNYTISDVMIKLLRKYGCDVKIHKGFYFTEKTKSCEMFKPILDMMRVKVEQDDLNKNGDSSYNAVLRETVKLLMNAPSGKVIEGLHINKIEYVPSLEKLVNIQTKYGNVNIIKVVGAGVMVEYKKDELEVLESEQRPVYLGVLIYDYAKTYMFENSYSIIGLEKLIYTDTDATKLRLKDAVGWVDYATKTKVPHWEEVEDYDINYKTHMIYNPETKVFGSFEDELSKINKVEGEAVFSCVQKKSWCYSKGNITKFRFKGLNSNNILLTGDEDFLILKNNKLMLNPNKQREINDFYNTDKNHLSKNAVNFFKNIYDKKPVLVLCCQFKKNVRNAKKYVGVDDVEKHNDLMNSVSVNYIVKLVKVK